MIDEAIGKILGMAMAYGVSALGLFLAYANYRKRTLKADKIMTGTAWMVVGLVFLSIAGGVVVVSQLVQPPSEAAEASEAAAESKAEAGPAETGQTEAGQKVVDSVPPASSSSDAPKPVEEPRERWPLLGMILPASIFLVATWITAGLHRHFSTAPTGE